MPPIHIARNHRTLGSFTHEEVRSGILSGRFTAGDLAWREGMPEWRPLGEMAPQWGMELPPPDLAPVIPDEGEAGAGSAEESGPAWEDRERLGILTALSTTVSDVLMRPTKTFSTMRRTGGLVDPLIFYVSISCIIALLSAIYDIGSILNTSDKAFAETMPSFLQHITRRSVIIYQISILLLTPAIGVVYCFLFAGITHVSLILVRGARMPFETTFRMNAYLSGAFCPLTLLMEFFNFLGLAYFFLGVLVCFIWMSYAYFVGLKESQGISGWKATLALTLPSLLCCGLLLLLGAAAGFGMAELGRHGH